MGAVPLKATAERLPNVRYIDPVDLFCDARECRPFEGNRVFYRDSTHLTPIGAERLLAGFDTEFRWLVGPSNRPGRAPDASRAG